MGSERPVQYTTIGLDPTVRDSVNEVRDEMGEESANDAIKELIRRYKRTESQASLNRKIRELDVSNSDEAIIRLIQYHDILPDWVETRKDLKRLINGLPDGTRIVIKSDAVGRKDLIEGDICGLRSGNK